MSIKIDSDRVLGAWSIELRLREHGKACDGNWLAFLVREEKGYTLQFRYRWYVDERVTDSKDRRSFYTAEFGRRAVTESEAIERARGYFEVIRSHGHSEQCWELLRGARTGDEFMEALRTMPGMHIGEPTQAPPT